MALVPAIKCRSWEGLEPRKAKNRKASDFATRPRRLDKQAKMEKRTNKSDDRLSKEFSRRHQRKNGMESKKFLWKIQE